MNEPLVAALAQALGLPLPPERVADVAASLDAQMGACSTDVMDAAYAFMSRP